MTLAGNTQKMSFSTFYTETLFLIANRYDKDILMIAVTSDGYSLQFASNDMKNNKEIVKTAIISNSYSIQYAGTNLRNDKEIIIFAINKGCNIHHICDNMKNDKDVILEFTRQ